MPRIERRSLLVAALGAPAILASGRSSAQADDRPVITIAVQQIVNANALDTLREQSNVGERVFASLLETLIGRNHQGRGEMVPQLATEWRRIDDRSVELTLRRGVLFHNGDELNYQPEKIFQIYIVPYSLEFQYPNRKP